MRRAVYGLYLGMFLMGGCAADGTSAPSSGDAAARAERPASGEPPTVRKGGSGTATAAHPHAPGTAYEDRIIAHVNGEPIAMKQLLEPLIESHGLNVLVNLVQVEMAKQDAAKAGVTVSPTDFQAERQSTLEKLFKASDDKTQDQIEAALKVKDEAKAKRLREEMAHDHESLLNQFLDQQHISSTEFDIVLQINTYLRKMAEPAVNKSITEESLRNAFNQLYGEKVRVQYIQLRTPLDVAAVQARLTKGEKFGDLARELSTNRASAELEGELPAFSRETSGLPQNFKDAAFGLKVGEVSDMVQANGAYHLIKLIDRIPPRVVTFEKQRDSVHSELYTRAIQATVKQMRESLAEQAIRGLKIEDPALAKQFDQRVRQHETEVRDQQKIRDDWERQHNQPTTRPGLLGTKLPATGPAATEPAVTRPPATRPAEAPNP